MAEYRLISGGYVACLGVVACFSIMSLWIFACRCPVLPCLATIKKSIRLREEALAKEQEKATSSQISAEKLRKILKEEKRMKKKRKRSASSSSSSSTSSRNSSPSSSSSSRRRAKKKKKKRRRSERGSKRHRRVSSRESRKSQEGKGLKDGKVKEEDEVEWFPAPPNTSATFLNQKGGPGFGERDEEAVTVKDVDDRRICQLYSLSAASEEEECDSSRRERKRRDREEDKRKNSLSRSPGRKERGSRSSERRDMSREREKKDFRKERRDSDSKRRSSLDENRKRRVSCSSAESEYSRKSDFKSEYLGNSVRGESKMTHDSSKRNSLDGGRYENREQEMEEAQRDDGRKWKEEGDSRGSNAGNYNRRSSLTSVPQGRPTKDLPTNLLDIFNQIEKFEREKRVGPK